MAEVRFSDVSLSAYADDLAREFLCSSALELHRRVAEQGLALDAAASGGGYK